jgi:surfactin family lipopeptide synthetase A
MKVSLTPEVAGLSEAKRKILEKYLRGGFIQAAVDAGAITPRPRGEFAPLSLAQEQLWLRSQTPGIPPLYNESITLRRRGRLDVTTLQRSITEIIRRHEIWRTTYETSNGRPFQVSHPAPSPFPLPVMDLRALPGMDREGEAVRLATEEAHRPFDQKSGPLLRAVVVRTADEDYRLSMTAHLSIVDGMSVYQVFLLELTKLYEAFSTGKASPLPELPIQYADYAWWQRWWVRGEVMQKQLNYWRSRLAGEIPVLQWPNDHPRPAVQTFRGAIRSFAWPRHLGDTVKELSQREGVTLFAVLQAGFAALLHRYTRQDDIIVGTFSSAGRQRSEVQGLLGYFLNPVALRIDLSGDPPFSELLRQTQKVTSEAISHDDLPIEFLAEELLPKRDASRHPFFTVAISLQPPIADNHSGWSVTSMDAESGGALWDLYLAFIEQPAGMMGRVQYNPDLFEESTIIDMVEDLQTLLAFVAANPHQRLSVLNAPPPRRKQR